MPNEENKSIDLSARANDILNSRRKKKDDIELQKQKEALERAKDLVSKIFDIFEASSQENDTSKWIWRVKVEPSKMDEGKLNCGISIGDKDPNYFHDIEKECEPGNNVLGDMNGIHIFMAKVNGLANTPNILQDACGIINQMPGEKWFEAKFDDEKNLKLIVDMKKFE